MKKLLSELRLYVCNNLVTNIPSHSIRLWFYIHMMKFKIGHESYVFMGCTFDCSENLMIGKNSVINANCRIDNRGGIIIGNNVSISNEVCILTADHDMDSHDFKGRHKEVKVNDFVWIGTRAMVMPGVVIGAGAVVAAGALVTKNVESADVVAGIPAKIIKQRKQFLTNQYTISYRRLFQ